MVRTKNDFVFQCFWSDRQKHVFLIKITLIRDCFVRELTFHVTFVRKWLIAFFAFPQLQTIRSFGKCGRDHNTLVPPSPPSEQNLWQTNRIQRDFFLCSEPNRSNNVRCNICHVHTLNQRKFLQLFFRQRKLLWT